MTKLGCLLLVWAICEAVVFGEEQDGFVQPLDFGEIFDSGVTSLSSNPLAAAVLKVDKNQYPKLFDTIVSSSIDSIQTRLAPNGAFSAESFGFNPIASQGFLPPGSSAKLVAAPRQQAFQQQQAIPIGQQLAGALRYDIRTVHDPYYKVYKPEEEDQGEEILAALKKNPSVAAYFKPAETNVEVAHPLNYRKEELSENSDEQNYKPNAYITGHPRLRRYTSGRQRANLKKSSEEEDDPYNYKAEYVYKPKAFDSELYSAYKELKSDPKKEYEYPYGGGYDSGYDHKEYERIKSLSEKQAAEIKQNPGNCKEVTKDGMTCTTCKDPKTGGNFESCSYVAEPKNNKYAYSKERKFDSNDEPEEADASQQAEPVKKSEKYEQGDNSSEQKFGRLSAAEPHKGDDSSEKYKSYYTHSSKPTPSEALRAAEDKQSSEEQSDESGPKRYDYQKALPSYYTDNEPKKDVEHVLAEFKKKDRSSCKKVQKNGMTCFQCIDKNGLKNEECMFVSESAPKRSHLAYQELKEFTSKPATLDEGSESQVVTTSAPPSQKSAAYVAADSSNTGRKIKRKKTPQTIVPAAANPVASAVKLPSPVATPRKIKRSVEAEAVAEENSKIEDETNIAPPEEFAGADSKGAFWAETMPRYSASLGVTLPEYMLSRSEHEVSFDETVASA